MKKFHLSFFLFLSLSSCILDRQDKCPSDLLLFEYKADQNQNVLPQFIDEAIIFIYNREGKLSWKSILSTSELADPKGVNLPYLDPGNYRIIGWGNATHSFLKKEYILKEAYITSQSPLNNDALYFASEEIEVIEPNSQKHTIYFNSAHIKLHVICTNYSEIYGDEKPPLLEIVDVGSRYLFNQEGIPRPDQLNTYLLPFKKKDKDKHEIKFNTFRFETKNNIKLKLKHPKKNQILKEINLQEYIKDRQPPIDFQQELILKIEFEFSPLGIIIKPPLWVEKPLLPDLT